jgi:hypothetical protein
MKGNFFSKPLEYKLTIAGEAWTQGEIITGSLIIEDHSKKITSMSELGCHLCYCSRKKLKDKDPKAITVFDSALIQNDNNELSFKFPLQDDCPISDSLGSFYIICGDMAHPFDTGMLELKINPSKVISDFVQVFESFYRFKVKSFKNKKDYIVAAVTPPDSKEWAKLQKMNIQLKHKQDQFDVEFITTLKKIALEHSITTTKDENKVFKKTLSKKEYERFGATNQDAFNKLIQEVLEQVKLKPIL